MHNWTHWQPARLEMNQFQLLPLGTAQSATTTYRNVSSLIPKMLGESFSHRADKHQLLTHTESLQETGCWLAAVPGGQTPPWGVSNTAWAEGLEGSPWALPERCVWLWALQVKEHMKVIEMPSEEGNTASEQSVFPPFVSPLDTSFPLKLIKLKA